MWYFIQRRGVLPRGEWSVTLDEHLVWMKRMHEEGKILFSGPSADHALGMYVIRAGSRDEAERIAASDPYTAGGCCTYDLFEWDVRQIMGVGPFTVAELQGAGYAVRPVAIGKPGA